MKEYGLELIRQSNELARQARVLAIEAKRLYRAGETERAEQLRAEAVRLMEEADRLAVESIAYVE